MSDLDKNKTPETENTAKKETSKIKDEAKSSLLQELDKEAIQRMKDRYGDTKDSFVK